MKRANSRSAAARSTRPIDRNPFSRTFLAELPDEAACLAARAETRATFRRLGKSCLTAVAALTLIIAPLWASNRAAKPQPYELSSTDTALLDEMQVRAVRFFLEQTDPVTGLARDRAPKDGTAGTAPSSAAATGFALTAWCIADERGWLEDGEAQRRVRKTLRFVLKNHAHERGWLYHFVDARTGERVWESEASTIDTALFLQGALLAREYLCDPEVTALVNAVYARIDWRWALNGGTTLSHGWTPEHGFIPHRWDSYSELMGLYLLGIGASEQPLPAQAWHSWRRGPLAHHGGRTFIQCGPLFTHQYAHGWFDFRGRRDGYANYWQNSIDATLAQRDWSAMQSGRFEHWSEDMWGLTASDGPDGYKAWGTPGVNADQSDGSLVPCAPGGSLPFAPRECLAALHQMRQVGGTALWGRYGFADAFNPETGWTSPDVIAIDVGITLVMAENLRSGFVWRQFMRAPEVRRGMERAGFTPAGDARSPASFARARDQAPGGKS